MPTDVTFNSTEPEPAWVCEHCLAPQGEDDCSTEVLIELVRSAAGSRYFYTGRTEPWCDDCVSSDATMCEDYLRPDNSDVERALHSTGGQCSVDFASNYLYWSDSAGYYRVHPEIEEEEDEEYDSPSYNGTRLLNYSTNVLDVLGWPTQSDRRGLVMGVELEMEPKPGRDVRTIIDTLGGSDGTKAGCAILKSDGSLDDGAELVTQPFSLAYHQNSGFWQKLLDSDLHQIARSGVGTSNCGIHVHINRAALSPLTIGKMVVFLNNPENGGFVSTVAQRRSGGYCRRDAGKKVTDGRRGSGDRYDIINVNGGATVEIRMFRGNLRAERVLKNVEFCHALVEFCKASGIKESSRWAGFVQFVSKARKQYPNLVAFLADRGFVPLSRNPNAPAVAASDL